MNIDTDYAKYESFIRVGQSGTQNDDMSYSSSDLANFPTPSSLATTLADVDKDPFTDLQGYTHRNRVRHDVLSIEIGYQILSDNDLAYILNRISPEWIYIELTNKKTKVKTVHKMYASDKKFDCFHAWIDNSGNWHEKSEAFSVTFVEE